MEGFPRLNCIVVDDEEHGIENLKRCIRLVPRLTLVNAYTDPHEALREITGNVQRIDFLFLDIDMPGLSGLDLALAVRAKVDKLIFVTAHSKYSLKAYEVLCNQYLLKPFTNEQFLSAIGKLIVPALPSLPDKLEFIFVKSGSDGRYEKIRCDDIILIKAMEHYVVIQTRDKKFMQHAALGEVEVSLSANPDFLRIHKSYIVSKRHILSVKANAVMMSNLEEVSVGTTYKAAFGLFMGMNSIG